MIQKDCSSLRSRKRANKRRVRFHVLASRWGQPFDAPWSVSDTSQMNSRVIVPGAAPVDCQVDPSLFVPRLLPGETVQGLLTTSYISPRLRIETFSQRSYSRVALSELLYVFQRKAPESHRVHTLIGRTTHSFCQKTSMRMLCRLWSV